MSWRDMLRDLPRQHGHEPLRVEGRLPPDLRGTLYRNGPALFGLAGEPYRHWFDGDGAITAVRLDGARATGACRVTETPWLRAERAAGRRLYRNYAQPGIGWRRWALPPKSTANIGVMRWQGELLALFEAGLPVAVDPETLHTRGLSDLGVVRHALSAHPHQVGDTTWSFGLRVGPVWALELYTFGPRGARRAGQVALPWPTLVHDFAVTEHHLVFFILPWRIRVGRLLAGVADFRANLAWEPERGVEVIVVPKAAPERAARWRVPAFFQWHVAHAWEEGGAVWVDHVTFDDDTTDAWFGRLPWEDLGPPPRSRLTRTRLDPAARRSERVVLWDRSCEFPAVEARADGPPRATWLLVWGASAVPCLGCLPADGGFRPVPLGPGCFPSEPVLAGRHVLSLVYDDTRDASFLAIIDATRPEDGPVARAWFDHAIPFTFHGAWAPFEEVA